MRNYLLIAFALISCISTLNAQSRNEFQLGIAMPQGDFAVNPEDTNDTFFYGTGSASTGLHFNYKRVTPLILDGLYWTLNAGIVYNNLQRDLRDEFQGGMDSDEELSLPKHINIPLLGGLEYETSVSDKLDLYGELGIGLNIYKMTSLSEKHEHYEASIIPKPSASFGYKIGAGLIFEEKYTLSLNYWGLGSHLVDYTVEKIYDGDPQSEDGRFEDTLSTNSLTISFGYIL